MSVGATTSKSVVFPERPLELQRSYVIKQLLGGILGVLLCVALVVGGGLFSLHEARKTVHSAEVWEQGLPASEVSVEGRSRTKRFFIHDVKLEVRYRDALGDVHEHPLELVALGGAMDSSEVPSVRYLQSRPEDFALSWAEELRMSRWAFIGFLLVGLIGGGIGVAFETRASIRRALLAKKCARRSQEILLDVTRVKKEASKVTYHYEGKLPNGRSLSFTEKLAAEQEPLFANKEKTKVVALATPGVFDRAIVPRSDCYPFSLDAEQALQVRAALAASPQVQASSAVPGAVRGAGEEVSTPG